MGFSYIEVWLYYYLFKKKKKKKNFFKKEKKARDIKEDYGVDTKFS
jgi:hypothetical protein